MEQARERRINERGGRMNRERRKRLEKAVELLKQAMEIIENARDEEQEAVDNLPESIKDSECGENMESYIDLLDAADGSIYEAIDSINDVL